MCGSTVAAMRDALDDPGRIEAVFVDNGGVLTLPDPVLVGSAGIEVLDRDLDRAHAEAAAAYDQWAGSNPGADLFSADDEGRQVFLSAYARALGVPAEDARLAGRMLGAAFRDHGRPWNHVRPGVVDALHAIRAAGRRIAIVSNAVGTAAEELADLAVCQVGPGPGCAVDAVIDSGVVGIAKPDPEIFRIALDAVDVPPERAVHVGDSVHADVGGARAAGLRALHLDPHGVCPAGDADHGHVRSLAEVARLLDRG